MKNKYLKKILFVSLALVFVFSMFSATFSSMAETKKIYTHKENFLPKFKETETFNVVSLEELKSMDYDKLIEKSAEIEGVSVNEVKLRLERETNQANLDIAKDILLYNKGNDKVAEKYLGLVISK